jgi:hypothetical protein
MHIQIQIQIELAKSLKAKKSLLCYIRRFSFGLLEYGHFEFIFWQQNILFFFGVYSSRKYKNFHFEVSGECQSF